MSIRLSYNKLVIDGVQVPHATKEGYSITPNKVWSKNAGRSGNGTMLGDIVAIKYTVRQKIDRMTQAELTPITNAIDSTRAFHTATYMNSRGEYVTGTFYSADVTYTVEKYDKKGNPIYKDIQIELIEQ